MLSLVLYVSTLTSNDITNKMKQKNSFKDHIFNASLKFHVQHNKNSVYDEDLKIGDIILTNCMLDKFCEAKGAKLSKVGFKLLGIGFIDKGIHAAMEVWSITASPSKQTLCMLYPFLHTRFHMF